MDFPGVLNEERACRNSTVQLKKEVDGISRGYQEKVRWNFNEPWFLALEFPTVQGVSHNFGEFPWLKLCFFWNF